MFTKKCEYCGQPFSKGSKANTKRHRFCSLKCFGQHLREKHKRHCLYCGKEISRRHRQTKYCSRACFAKAHTVPPQTFTCIQCGEGFTIKLQPSRAGQRKFCSQQCHYEWMCGENSPNWHGGRESYYGPNWPAQRRATRKRDNYTCRICSTTENSIEREMDVHHVIPIDAFEPQQWEEANCLDNLITLCHSCHLKVHNSGFKLPPK